MALLFAALPCLAQKGGGGSTGGGGGTRGSGGGSPGGGNAGVPRYPTIYENPTVEPAPLPYPNVPSPPSPVVIIEDEKCFPWNFSEARDTAISVTRLQIPSKARSEYEKSCDANRKNKFDDAESHARGAIEKFQNYAAAWVMLGLVLEEEHKGSDARDACLRATKVDSRYLPAYLCQAEFSARDQQWDAVSNLANLSLGLNSTGDGYAYYYLASAEFHQNKLEDAKKNALRAAEIDVTHDDVPLYFLLAQIYQVEGEKWAAAAQLRQILKHHTDRQQEQTARESLAKLESELQSSAK